MKRLPKIFRKELKEKKWQAKIVKKVHLPKDREFIQNLYSQGADGKMTLREELTPGERKRLLALNKVIRKNRGTLVGWKLGLLGILVGGVTVFNLLFKNLLIEKGFERGVGKILGSDVDLQSPQLFLLKGRFDSAGLVIQSPERPNKNLFDLGQSAFQFNLPEVTRRRFHIEEMTILNFRLNTPRAGGELPTSSTPQKSTGQSLLAMPTIDPQALFDKATGELQSIKHIEGLNEQAEALRDYWEEFPKEKWEEDIGTLENDIKKLTEDIQSVNSLEETLSFGKDSQALYSKVQTLRKEALAVQDRFNQDRAALTQGIKTGRELVKADTAYLQKLMGLPQGGGDENLLSSILEGMVREAIAPILAELKPLIDISRKLEQQREGKKKEEKPPLQRAKGRFISYPSPQRPTVLVKKFEFQGGDDYSGYYTVLLRDLSSEPENWYRPTDLQGTWDWRGRQITLEGTWDRRREATRPLSLTLASPMNPFQSQKGIPQLGVGALGGMLSFEGEGYQEEGVFNSRYTFSFSDVEIKDFQGPALAQTLWEGVARSLKNFEVGLTMGIEGGELKDLRVKSDLDRVIKESFGSLIQDMARQNTEVLQDYINAQLAEQFGENWIDQGMVDGLGESIVTLVEGTENLEDQLALAEKSLGEQKQRLQRKTEQKLEEELDKNLDNLKNKLPGFSG